jgi:hypothetical protein
MIKPGHVFVTEYAAMPNAIPTTEWFVVPIDKDGNPVRISRLRWRVISTWPTFDKANAEAQRLTRMLQAVRL